MNNPRSNRGRIGRVSGFHRRDQATVLCRSSASAKRTNIAVLVLLLTLLFAFSFCRSALAADPYQTAVALYGQGKFGTALKAFQAAEAAGIQPANAAYYEGLCFHQLKNMKEARQAYMNVLNKYPSSKVAQQALKTLMQMDPSLAAIITSKAKALSVSPSQREMSGLPENASFHFQKAPRGGHMIVDVYFNGKPTKAMFDTGAGRTTCKQTLLDQLGVQPRFTGQSARMTGVGGEVQVKVGEITVQLGNLARKLLVMVDTSSKSSADEVLTLPLIGQDFLDGFSCEIDNANGVVALSKAARAPIAKGQSTRLSDNEVAFYRDGSHIIVKPKINGRECEMILDTGAGVVAFADRHLAMCGLNRPTSAYGGTSGGVGGTKEGYHFTIDTIQLGPVTKRNVSATVMLHADFPKPLLGQPFLSDLKYEIDSSRNVLRFKNDHIR